MRRHPGGCVSQRSDCLHALMLRIGYLTLLAARAVVARVGGMRRADKTPGSQTYRRSHRDDWIAAELRGRRRTSSRSEIIPASLPSIALRKRVAENLCSQLHNGSGFLQTPIKDTHRHRFPRGCGVDTGVLQCPSARAVDDDWTTSRSARSQRR